LQIRFSRDLEGRARVAPSPMTVEEFFARSPEVPRDLRDEPVLGRVRPRLQLPAQGCPEVLTVRSAGGCRRRRAPFLHASGQHLAVYGIGRRPTAPRMSL